jgi:uncharacterized iron-regulated membrane protein
VNAHSWTKLLFRIHSYTGLITGVAIILIGISGSILVFSRELDHFIYRAIQEVEPKGNKISLDSGLHFMQEKFQDMNYITYDGIPQSEVSSYKFFMMKDGVHYNAFLDPYKVEILHSGKRFDNIMEWLLLFHYSFSIPVWGELAAAVLSITLLISVFTGVVVYRKYFFKVLLFKVPVKWKNWRTISSSFHRIIGVWSLVFQILMAVTSFWMLRHTFTESHYGTKEVKGVDAPIITYSIDKTLSQIKERFPEFQPKFITLPEAEGVASYVYGHTEGISYFYADFYDEIQTDGQSLKAGFLKDKAFSEKLELMIYPIHGGLYGNLMIKVIYCLGGLTPAILSITGFLLWWRRRR